MSNNNNYLQTQTSSVLHNETVSSCSTSKVQEKTQLLRSRCMNSLRAIQSQFKFLTKTLQDFGTMPIFKRTFSQDLDLLEQHLTKEIISQTDCKTILTKLRTTFENAFNSEFKEHVDTFASTMLLNVDQLQKQLDKDEFQEDGSMTAFCLENKPVPRSYIDFKVTWINDSPNDNTTFVEYTESEVQHFRDTLLQHLGNVKKFVAKRTRHQRQYDRRVNKRQMQTQESKIDTGKALDTDLADIEKQ
ncbi:hypothetical protein Tco_0567857 [Tanacetum coccineum]